MVDSNMREQHKETPTFGKEYFGEIAPFWLRTVYFKSIAKKFAKLAPSRALDVGCADGALVNALIENGIDAYGVDISLYAIQKSPIKERLKSADIEHASLPFPAKYFDLVTAIEVFEHLEKPENAISEIARVLKPNGFFFMTTPSPCVENIRNQFACVYPLFKTDETHISVLPRKVWTKMLQKAGLKPANLALFGLKESIFTTLRNELIIKIHESRVAGPMTRQLKLKKFGKLSVPIKLVFAVGDLVFSLPQRLLSTSILAIKESQS